jgi:probable HAF family extracellular repeat protein
MPGYSQIFPYAMNSEGDVVGEGYNIPAYPAPSPAPSTEHAFVYHRGRFIDIGALLPPNTNSYAVGINAEGEVIGEFNDASGTHGFIYWSGRVQTIDIPNGTTYLRAINDNGQIVGNYGSASSLTGYAFLRQPNGTIVQLPNFEGGIFGAEAINNVGQIAGTVWLRNPDKG